MEKAQEVADRLAAATNTDVLLFNSPLQRDLDDQIITQCRKRRRRENVMVIVVTEGGDADPAFRIGRCLQLNYATVSVFISGFCKSAGTLLAAAGHEIIISDHGELGPLDVQMPKADDWSVSSGLTVTSSLRTMQAQAQEMFRTTVLELRRKMGGLFSAKTAAEIATKLTVGALAPIFQQIEAMHIGEAGRALKIARFYGERLADVSENLQDGALDHLLVGYPSHGYVIDRTEAEDLFVNVRAPSDIEMELSDALGVHATIPISDYDKVASVLLRRSVYRPSSGRCLQRETAALQDFDIARVGRLRTPRP
jgi:hypothetical protein